MTDTTSESAGQRTTDYFDALAGTYAQHRPSYAPHAIAAILEGLPAPVRAADIGCGTGIATRQLAQAGARMIGIDPSREMLDEARRADSSALPPIEYRIGAGEQTGLPDASTDVIVCAQAFHWFDAAAALREFHRVLKPGGRLALMWNVRQDDDAFSIAYNALMHRAQALAQEHGRAVRRNRTADPTMDGWFVNPRTVTFDNPHRFDWPSLLGRARSASYWPTDGPTRAAFEAELRQAFDAAQRGDRITLAQRTKAILADRAG